MHLTCAHQPCSAEHAASHVRKLVLDACSANGGYHQVVVKFFLRPADFHVEQALYATKAISKLLPPMTHACSNRDGAVRAVNGFVFPPWIVTERGSTLSEVCPGVTVLLDGVCMCSGVLKLCAAAC
jgi:hypothetical protein